MSTESGSSRGGAEDRVGDPADRGLDLGVADDGSGPCRPGHSQQGHQPQCQRAAVSRAPCRQPIRITRALTPGRAGPTNPARRYRDGWVADERADVASRRWSRLSSSWRCSRPRTSARRRARRCCTSRWASPAAALRPGAGRRRGGAARGPGSATPRPSACRPCGAASPATMASGTGRRSIPPAIAVTAGASGAFILAFLAAFDAGDRVTVPVPGYPAYRNILQALDVEVVPVPIDAATRFQPTPELLDGRRRAAPRPRAGEPRPTRPAPCSASRISRRLATYCRERGIRLVVGRDLPRHHLRASRPETVLATAPEAIVVNSFSKYFCMTGWRLGWLVLPPELVAAGRAGWPRTSSSRPRPSPSTRRSGPSTTSPSSTAASPRYRRNRDTLLAALTRAGLTRMAPPDGAFYLYVDVGGDHARFGRPLPRAPGRHRRGRDPRRRLRRGPRPPLRPPLLRRRPGSRGRGGRPAGAVSARTQHKPVERRRVAGSPSPTLGLASQLRLARRGAQRTQRLHQPWRAAAAAHRVRRGLRLVRGLVGHAGAVPGRAWRGFGQGRLGLGLGLVSGQVPARARPPQVPAPAWAPARRPVGAGRRRPRRARARGPVPPAAPRRAGARPRPRGRGRPRPPLEPLRLRPRPPRRQLPTPSWSDAGAVPASSAVAPPRPRPPARPRQPARHRHGLDGRDRLDGGSRFGGGSGFGGEDGLDLGCRLRRQVGRRLHRLGRHLDRFCVIAGCGRCGGRHLLQHGHGRGRVGALGLDRLLCRGRFVLLVLVGPGLAFAGHHLRLVGHRRAYADTFPATAPPTPTPTPAPAGLVAILGSGVGRLLRLLGPLDALGRLDTLRGWLWLLARGTLRTLVALGPFLTLGAIAAVVALMPLAALGGLLGRRRFRGLGPLAALQQVQPDVAGMELGLDRDLDPHPVALLEPAQHLALVVQEVERDVGRQRRSAAPPPRRGCPPPGSRAAPAGHSSRSSG